MRAQVAGNLGPVLLGRAVSGSGIHNHEWQGHEYNLTTEDTEEELLSHKKAQEAQREIIGSVNRLPFRFCAFCAFSWLNTVFLFLCVLRG